jgi:hypothetical protein
MNLVVSGGVLHAGPAERTEKLLRAVAGHEPAEGNAQDQRRPITQAAPLTVALLSSLVQCPREHR